MADKTKVVVLDPGHGGTTSAGGSSANNTSGNGWLEKDLTLDLARRVRELLEADARVFLTRDSDSNLSLSERAGFAKAVEADVFLSLHFNGHPDPEHDSTEVYVAPGTSPERRHLADALHAALSEVTGAASGGVVAADLGVLRPERHHDSTNAALAEIVDLTNQSQAAMLHDVEHRDRIAAAVASALRDQLARVGSASMAGALSTRSPEVQRVVDELLAEGVPTDQIEAFLTQVEAPAAAQALHSYPTRGLSNGATRIPQAEMLGGVQRRLLLGVLSAGPLSAVVSTVFAVCNRYNVTIGIGVAGSAGFIVGAGGGFGVVFAPGDRLGVYGSISGAAGFIGSFGVSAEVTVVHGGPEVFNGESVSLGASVSMGAGVDVAGHALFNLHGDFIGVSAELGVSVGSPFEVMAQYHSAHTSLAFAAAQSSPARSPEVQRVADELRAEGVPPDQIEAFLTSLEGPAPVVQATYRARALSDGQAEIQIPSAHIYGDWEARLLLAAMTPAPLYPLVAGIRQVANTFNVTIGVGPAVSGGFVAGAALGAGIVFAPGNRVGVYGSVSGILGAIVSATVSVQATVVQGGPANFTGSAILAGISISSASGPMIGAHAMLNSTGGFIGVMGEVGLTAGLSPFEAFAQYQYTASTLSHVGGRSHLGGTRTLSGIDYRVPGIVPLIQQPNSMACWATVTTMLTSWRDAASYPIETVLGGIGPQWLNLFTDGLGLPSSQKEQFLQEAGLEWEAPMSFSADGWQSMLIDFGPLWVTTDEQPGPSFAIHARVMTRISGDGTVHGTTVWFVDPGDGAEHHETLGQFMTKFEEEVRATGHTRIQVVHWPTGTQNVQSQSLPAAHMMSSDIPLAPAVGGQSIGADSLEEGDIILSTTDAFISDAIRSVSGSPVSHAALYIGDGMIIEAVGGGVETKTLEQALADDSLAVAFRVPGLSDIERQLIRDYAGQQLGQRFDGMGLVRQALFRLDDHVWCSRLTGQDREDCRQWAGRINLGTGTNDAFFCSELVLSAYAHAGVPLTGDAPHWGSPGDLAELSLTRSLAYVGHLKTPPVGAQALADVGVFGQIPEGYLFVPVAEMVPGIDVSHWQGNINWAQVAGAGIRYAYIKSSEGATGHQTPDAQFATNWAGALANGIRRGAYHLFKATSTPQAQAQHFMATVQHAPGDMPPALDVEYDDLQALIAQHGVADAWRPIWEWCQLVQAGTGYQPLLYMSERGVNSLHGNVGSLPALELWMPRYRNLNNLPPLPLDPATGHLIFPHWSFWQHSETGHIPGIGGNNVDLNVFNGNDVNFATWMANVQP